MYLNGVDGAIREDMLVRSREGGEVRSRLLRAGGRARAVDGHHPSFTGPVGAAEVSTSTFLHFTSVEPIESMVKVVSDSTIG